VKVSSSLLLKVLGTVRNAFLILWGMQMYGEEVSGLLQVNDAN
jgi:hypothetical protein